MRLVELAVLILETQAEVLRQLDSSLGRAKLLESISQNATSNLHSDWISQLAIQPNLQAGPNALNPFSMLEAKVQSLGLDPELEDLLWSFQPYRDLAESALDLNSSISRSNSHLWLEPLLKRVGATHKNPQNDWETSFKTKVLFRLSKSFSILP